MEWSDKTEVKKGNYGEHLVKWFLEDKGFVVYKPITNKAHAFDGMAIRDKKTILIYDVKSKARLNNYNATGFNIRNYNEYKHISNKYNIHIFIFFVDEMLGKIYGNWLHILEKPYKSDLIYPNSQIVSGIILFSMDKMMEVVNLKRLDINFLKNASTRNYEYKIIRNG